MNFPPMDLGPGTPWARHVQGRIEELARAGEAISLESASDARALTASSDTVAGQAREVALLVNQEAALSSQINFALDQIDQKIEDLDIATLKSPLIQAKTGQSSNFSLSSTWAGVTTVLLILQVGKEYSVSLFALGQASVMNPSMAGIAIDSRLNFGGVTGDDMPCTFGLPAPGDPGVRSLTSNGLVLEFPSFTPSGSGIYAVSLELRSESAIPASALSVAQVSFAALVQEK